MAIMRIEGESTAVLGRNPWDIGDDALATAPRIPDFAAEAARLRECAVALRQIPAMDLVDYFESARLALSRPPRPGQAVLPGIAYLHYFLAGSNLKRLLEAGLKGDVRHLDGFLPMTGLGKRVRALPRGLITHWLAGNVPALGLISLVQGILTKNANVVKLPRRNGLALPALFREICELDPDGTSRSISHPAGRAVSAAVAFVYCEPGDAGAQAALSRESDVRVAWGGAEALGAIGRLPRKPGSEDVFFGPGYSLAVVGRECLAAAGLDKLADRLATDASVFDQRGCNSAQGVFVESGGAVAPRDFARALGAAMARALKRIPKEPAGAAEAYEVASVRSEYLMTGEVISSAGTEWTVVYADAGGPIRPSGSRVVFVRPVGDVMDIARYLSPAVQTVGLALDEPRRTAFADLAAQTGVSRIVPPGLMSLYDHPWDGMFPVERFVRWVSLE